MGKIAQKRELWAKNIRGSHKSQAKHPVIGWRKFPDRFPAERRGENKRRPLPLALYARDFGGMLRDVISLARHMRKCRAPAVLSGADSGNA
jgi:hypothetical protein